MLKAAEAKRIADAKVRNPALSDAHPGTGYSYRTCTGVGGIILRK